MKPQGAIYERKAKELVDAETMLQHWLDKPEEFWLRWNGKSRKETIENWELMVKIRQAELDKYLRG